MEYAAISDTFSPTIHRINQAVRRKAIEPNEPVKDPAEILIKYSKPPQDLVAASNPALEVLRTVAELKKGM